LFGSSIIQFVSIERPKRRRNPQYTKQEEEQSSKNQKDLNTGKEKSELISSKDQNIGVSPTNNYE